MAEISEGWDGTVNEAGIARILSAATAPRIESGFTLETVSGQRRVVLAPGESHHAFIRYTKDTSTQFTVPTPSAGRFYLLVQRRDWTANAVTHLLLPATETEAATPPIAPPAAYPSEFEDTPGVIADIALHWVWVRFTDTLTRSWPITQGRLFSPFVGSVSQESSDFVAPNVEKQAIGWTFARALEAGTLLHFTAQLDIYMPPSDVGGYARIVRYTDSSPVEIAVNRWHSHSRGDRWIQPVITGAVILERRLDAGTNFALRISNDPLSAGQIEFWNPRASWFTL